MLKMASNLVTKTSRTSRRIRLTTCCDNEFLTSEGLIRWLKDKLVIYFLTETISIWVATWPPSSVIFFSKASIIVRDLSLAGKTRPWSSTLSLTPFSVKSWWCHDYRTGRKHCKESVRFQEFQLAGCLSYHCWSHCNVPHQSQLIFSKFPIFSMRRVFCP